MSDEMFSHPFDELFATKHEAYEDGRYRGAAGALSLAREALSHLSVKYETTSDEKFHAIEEACAVLRRHAEMIEAERERYKAGAKQLT